MTPIEAFELLDLRTGKITQVELNREAIKPAYKIWIDFGELGVKTTSGQYTGLYQPEELIDKIVVCAVNLGKRRIAGFTSEVLMLGVPQGSGEVVYLSTERKVTLGTRVF